MVFGKSWHFFCNFFAKLCLFWLKDQHILTSFQWMGQNLIKFLRQLKNFKVKYFKDFTPKFQVLQSFNQIKCNHNDWEI